MELRHLRYFVAVAEERNFSRAAQRVGIEQSPLSRSIRDLERDLGVVLFKRTTRSSSMTPAGQILLPHARLMIEAAEHARNAVKAATKESPEMPQLK